MDKIKIAMDVSKAMANLNKYVTNNINSSKTNNSKPVESIDLDDISNNAEVNQTDISSNQVNVSDIANSYNIDTTDLEIYQASLEKELEFYQVMLEDTENELGILKEDAFAESGTNLSVIENMCKDYENTIISEIYQLIEQYKMSCPEEKLEKFGINQADVTSMSYAELFEILKEKDDDVKEKLASIEEYKKENLDKAISENTEFSTYDEYLKRIEELESQQVTLNSAIYKTEQLKKMAKYEFLVKEEDYQNFNYECQIDKSVIEEMRMQMGTQVSYSEYCSKTGDKISPLEFCIWVQDNYPDTTATAMDNETLLKTLISVADKDSDLIKTYNYLFEKEGIESANKYLEDIEDQINQLAGQKKAEKFLAGLEKDENGNYNYEDIMNHFKVTGKGLGDGAQSFFLGLAAWHQSSDVYSVEEYESLYILEALSGDKEFANFLDNNYEISMSVGNMLPSMAAGMLLTPAAGTFLMGASAGGNSYHQALVNGASIRDAVFYGVLSGTSEATLEKYLGAIPGLSDIKVSSLKDLGKSVLKEGTEEWTQEYVDAALRGTVLGEQIEGDQLNADALKSFIYGSIIGGIMNSPSAISGEVSNRTGSSNIESNITNTVNEDVSNLTSEVKDSISAINSSVIQESVSKSIAEKISKSIKSLNIPGLSAIKKITEGSKNIALSTSNAINIESVIDNVTSAGIDNIEFLESDIKALMANSTFENQTDLWDVTRIRDNFTKILRGKIDLNIVNKVIDNVNIIDASYWQQFLKTNGYNSNLVGFVNHTGNVFFPSNANMHMVMHELFHKFSELRELYSTDIYGNKRKVTGIREYYSDGRESSFANEALTEYLSSKYYDKKIYNYMYGVEGTRLWERVDNAISSKYGDDFLLDCYLNNNTNALREIFNQYVYQGAYDDFVLAMGSDSDHVYIYKNLDSLKDIVSKLEKSMGPKGIKGIIQSIFGSKSNKTNNTNRIENVSSNINNTQAYNTINNIFIELSRGVGSKEYASTALENYMYTGNKSEIASISPQIASMLDSVSKDEIDNYLLANHTQIQYQYRRLQDFVKTMDSKKYNGYGMKALEEYITYDNLNAITRTDNIRDKIQLIPKEIIEGYIRRNKNMQQNVNSVANGVNSGIPLQNSTNQNYSNQFLESDIRALGDNTNNINATLANKNYKNTNQSSANLVTNIVEDIAQKVGSQEAFVMLEDYINTGLKDKIMSISENAAKALETVDFTELRNYLLANSEYYAYSELQKAISIMDNKNSKGYGIKALEDYLKNGNDKVFTRENNVRETIKNIPPKVIQYYITNIDSINEALIEGATETADLSEVQQIIQKQDQNIRNLKQEVLDEAFLSNDLVCRLRSLYIELNKRLHYDFNYRVMNETDKANLYNKRVTYENLTSDKVICKGWSELFRDLLLSAGFDTNKVKIIRGKSVGSHNWVQVDFDDFMVIADATEALNGSTDLANCKAGLGTNGFVILPKKFSGSHIRSFLNIEKYHNADYLKEVDRYIGYASKSGYLADTIKEANLAFDNSLKYSYDIRADDLIDMEIPENMSGDEYFAYMRQIKNIMFTAEELSKHPINIKLRGLRVGNEVESLAFIEIVDEKKYVLYSESLGKHVFTDTKECLEFINRLPIINLK